MVATALSFLLIQVLLTGGCWGLVGIWLTSGVCYSDEYNVFFGMWVASLVLGLTAIAVAWGSQVRILAALLLGTFMLFLLIWVEYGHLVVTACPNGGF